MAQDLLRFPAAQFTEKRMTVDVDGKPKEVCYRAWEHLCYVKDPIDAAYQSLDVLEPIRLDGENVDASDAPIFFMIGVGGYMSDSNFHPFAPQPVPPEEPAEDDGPAPLPLPGLGGMAGADAYIAIALAMGFVVVHPGCRGRDCRSADGTFFGKAPAAIVDLKAAVRYLRHNADILPGDTGHILCSGGSAGGALSCLLAASGNVPDYEPYLRRIGAAEERDDVFASASFSPIVNLEHSDAAYEWEFGSIPCGHKITGPFRPVPGMVDQTLSPELAALFDPYQDELARQGKSVPAEQLEGDLLQRWLFPEAERYFATLPEEVLEGYLALRPWITRTEDGKVSFTFRDYAAYTRRGKGLPAFDDFSMEMAEPNLFGNETTDSRHFTPFSQAHDPHAAGDVPADVAEAVRLMNPMNFTENPHGCAKHWWIRHGAADNNTALPIVTDLCDALAAAGKDVNARLIWDGGHCDDDDPVGLFRWMLSKI